MNIDFIVIVSGIFGLLLGSFANVIIYRYPLEIPLGFRTHSRSFCPECKKQIAFYDNIPVLSWILLKGRCRQCQAKISVRYPVVELLSGVLFALTASLYLRYVPSKTQDWMYWADFIKVHYFVFSLIAVTFVDLACFLIPDRFSIGNWIIAMGACLLLNEPEIWQGISGGLVGAGFFYAMAFVFEKWKGVEGLGLGDVKMIGWLGTWLGISYLPILIVMSSLSGVFFGLILMRQSKEGFQTAIPFGPFLALGGYLTWILKVTGIWLI